MAAAARSIDPKPGQSLEVLHYGGGTQPVQAFTVCAVTEVGSATGRLDCLLSELGRGAPLLSNGTPIGIIKNSADQEGATFSLFRSSGMELIQTEEVIFPVAIFAGIDVINACDVDIHQGLFWLDIDGIT